MLKTGIITQARMTSTRLPGKILLKINGKTILQYHLERLKQSGIPVFVATTNRPTDDPVEKLCVKTNTAFYRGDENNVLGRYFECALKNKLDVIVRVTSDCPLIDGEIIQDAVSKYLKMNAKNLYFSNCIERTFPRGFDFEIFSFDLLKEANEKADSDFQKEHVTPYIEQNVSGRVKFYSYIYSSDNSRFRITLDTPEDFKLIEQLIGKYHCDRLDAAEIISVMQTHPELAEINKEVKQKTE